MGCIWRDEGNPREWRSHTSVSSLTDIPSRIFSSPLHHFWTQHLWQTFLRHVAKEAALDTLNSSQKLSKKSGKGSAKAAKWRQSRAGLGELGAAKSP